MLRKITYHTTFSYQHIWQKVFGKARKTFVAWSILRGKFLNYIPQLTWSEIQQRCFARNLKKVLFAALKDEKGSHDDNEGKSTFQTIGIDLSKQTKKRTKKQTKKEHLS